MSQKTAVVAGGAGFLGSHLTDRLLAEGYNVTVVDNLITGDLSNVAHLEGDSRFKYINLDVTKPFDIEGDVDIVYNLASPASPIDFLKMPIETLLVGSYGTKNLLDLAVAKKARFFMASTSEVYGDPLVHPQTEEYWGNVNCNGTRSCYDEAKRFSEAISFAYHRKFGLDIKVIRIFNTYGPRMRVEDGRVVPTFLKQALLGEPITIYGTGAQTRAFCYVSDLVDGIFKLAESKEHGPINVGNPVEMTMLQFAEHILAATKSNSQITYVPLPTADDPMQRCPNNTKARERLGWEPKINLAEGIAKSIPYFKQKLGVE
ncbi:MAG TPA: UDP-glucuronic acid decarboxylase family protein [Capsulimonadaceae bacterium]|jgi:dTDP-glucose 4,6-dehydratase